MKKLSNLITIVMIAITMLQCKKSEATNPAMDKSAKTSQKHSEEKENHKHCLLYTSPSPRDRG